MSKLTLLATVLLFACGSDSDHPMGGGGTALPIGDDTGSAGGGEGAPTIDDFVAGFEDYGGKWVIEANVYYSDADDDVDGGQIDLAVDIDGEPLDLGDQSELPIDGTSARVDDDHVVFALSGDQGSSIDRTRQYDLTIQLQDSAGNQSADASTTIDPN